MENLYADHVRTLTSRYGAALAEAGFDAVVVHSGSPRKKVEWDDAYWPIRPTPELQHWIPVYEPNVVLYVEAGARARVYWPVTKDFWERPRAPEATWFESQLDVYRAEAPAPIATGKRIAFIGEDVGRAEGLGARGEGAVNPPKLIAALDRARTTKTHYEIACIAEANLRASRGHEALREAFADAGAGACELDLHLLYLTTTRQDDPETPYKNIVALGANASVLHHIAYGRQASRAASLLVDAGATCMGYCSDVTRTWVRKDGAGAAGATFAGLVAAMEAMQQRLCARVALGAPYEELHDESHRQVSAILKEAGIAKGSVEEIDRAGVSRVFYPHGLGHSLGLQTHDVGCGLTKPRADNPFLRNTSRIEKDQVFTIEPGLYFIDPLLAELREKPEGKMVDWPLVDQLVPFGGIRIEDDVHVRDGGVRNITREVLPLGGAAL